MKLVTIKICGNLERLVWFNGSLVRLNELRELLLNRPQPLPSIPEPVESRKN
jgi:hypothetical protein